MKCWSTGLSTTKTIAIHLKFHHWTTEACPCSGPLPRSRALPPRRKLKLRRIGSLLGDPGTSTLPGLDRRTRNGTHYNVPNAIQRIPPLDYNSNEMRLDHFAGAASIFMCTGLLWAQRFPDLDNQIPEVRVTEVLQSGNELKVTIENISSRTIRGLSLLLGKHRVDKDWSSLVSGGLTPNSKASLLISTAGLAAGGTRHHPAPPGKLQVLGAVFVDGGPVTARAAEPPLADLPPPRKEAAPPVQAARKVDQPPVKVAARAPAQPAEPSAVSVRANPVKTPPPTPIVEPISKPEPAPVVVPRPAEPQPVAPPAPKAESSPAPVPPPAATVTPGEGNKPDSPLPAPPRATGQPGTREQGSQDELAKLISLVAPFEPELASPYPRQALRKMVAVVVKEQNESTAQSAVTAFDEGQRSALQAFAFGLQTIQDRRDLDDDMLREQVQRFLKNRRQTLAK